MIGEVNTEVAVEMMRPILANVFQFAALVFIGLWVYYFFSARRLARANNKFYWSVLSIFIWHDKESPRLTLLGIGCFVLGFACNMIAKHLRA